jgi:hypothetical protein
MDSYTKHLNARDRALESVKRGVILALENAIRQIDKLKIGEPNTIELLNIFTEIETLLSDKELAPFFKEVSEIYADEIEYLVSTFAISGINPLSGVDKELLRTIIDADLNALDINFKKYAGDLKQTVANYALGGDPVDLQEVLAELPKRTASGIIAEVDTSLSGINRTLTVKKAVETFGDKVLFEYFGPSDGLTRPFCKKYLGQRLTKEQIQSIDNGQGLDPLLYGGGWNCRHQWRPVIEGMKWKKVKPEDD